MEASKSGRPRQRQLGCQAPATLPDLVQPGASGCAGGTVPSGSAVEIMTFTHPDQDSAHQRSMQTLHLSSHFVHRLGHVCTGNQWHTAEHARRCQWTLVSVSMPRTCEVSGLEQQQAASNRPMHLPPYHDLKQFCTGCSSTWLRMQLVSGSMPMSSVTVRRRARAGSLQQSQTSSTL